MRKTRLFSLTLLATALCLFAACGNDNTAQPTPTPTVAPTVTTAPQETTTPQETPALTTAPEEEGIKVITIAEALELCGESGNITTERYYIRGIIEEMKNAAYGNMVVKDETGSITVYGTYSADGSLKYSEMTDKAFTGDEVLLSCILQNYNGTKEVKNARLIEYKKNEIAVDDSAYTDVSVAAAREAANGSLVKVDGVVARITYANGQIPNGFILTDETSSIYVFDSDVAQRVAVGNKVTVLASKTWWVLEKEQASAEKFGYKGCNQLTDAILAANDEQTNDFDKSWVTENTVKAMLENPVENDITSLVYKVTALVKKVPGTGFINYYFYDLDGETGSYTYTQCNGKDFEWLDEFDGKICTVYLTALNAKSSNSGCIYRLLPVAVIDEGFSFHTADTAKHVVEYYGLGQFDSFYSGNPETELVTEVSSELLGFTGAELSYASDNTEVATFVMTEGKPVFHCVASGTANITVTATHDGVAYQAVVPVTVEIASADAYEYVTVADAIAAEKNTPVTVKGIVGPSLVNKTGFYLIDETGIIAVQVDEATMATLKLGNEVILQGTRDVKSKGGDKYFGQSNLYNSVVLLNLYGSHDYSTATFDDSITLADFYALDPKVDYSTKVYVLKATINFAGSAYSSNYELTDANGTKVTLYCSSAKQYAFLEQFKGQEVTLEIAPCNWNDKTYYRGCILAVRTEDGKVINTLNFAE